MENAASQTDWARARRAELVRRITLSVGSSEKQVTAITRLSLHRRTAPTAPCSLTCEPSIVVVAQGRKRVDLGRTTFLYGESRYLLASLDLPIVSRVIETSESAPCLAMMLRFELPVIRELISQEEIYIPESPPGSPAMTTGMVTPELLDACCLLVVKFQEVVHSI